MVDFFSSLCASATNAFEHKFEFFIPKLKCQIFLNCIFVQISGLWTKWFYPLSGMMGLFRWRLWKVGLFLFFSMRFCHQCLLSTPLSFLLLNWSLASNSNGLGGKRSPKLILAMMSPIKLDFVAILL